MGRQCRRQGLSSLWQIFLKQLLLFSFPGVCEFLNDKAVFMVTLTLTFSTFLFWYSQLQLMNLTMKPKCYVPVSIINHNLSQLFSCSWFKSEIPYLLALCLGQGMLVLVPQFSHLSKEDDDHTWHLVWWKRQSEIIYVKFPHHCWHITSSQCILAVVIITILNFDSHLRNEANLSQLICLVSTLLNIAKNMGFRQINLVSNFSSFTSVWPWVSSLSSLNLSIFMCKLCKKCRWI